MRIIAPSVRLEEPIDGGRVLQNLEKAGRTCYKSEHKISTKSAVGFLQNLMASGHESVIEHASITLRIVCDRGVSHEIVRHRLGSYCQESTRFCNYSRDQFANEITCICPCFWSKGSKPMQIWEQAMCEAEKAYFALLVDKVSAQEARSVLPTSLKTEIVVTYNLREWRHFLKLRTSEKAHPQIREIAVAILQIMKDHLPILFDDIPMPNNVKPCQIYLP